MGVSGTKVTIRTIRDEGGFWLTHTKRILDEGRPR